jgi:hypothetical protein
VKAAPLPQLVTVQQVAMETGLPLSVVESIVRTITPVTPPRTRRVLFRREDVEEALGLREKTR